MIVIEASLFANTVNHCERVALIKYLLMFHLLILVLFLLLQKFTSFRCSVAVVFVALS